MAIEIVMYRRDRNGNKLPEQIRMASLDGSDIDEFWQKNKGKQLGNEGKKKKRTRNKRKK